LNDTFDAFITEINLEQVLWCFGLRYSGTLLSTIWGKPKYRQPKY